MSGNKMTYDDIIRCGDLFKKAKRNFFESWGISDYEKISDPVKRCEQRWESMKDINQAFIEEGAIGDFLSLKERKELKIIWNRIIDCVKTI